MLSYEDTGGSGLPVLLLHGFPLTSESFRPQLDALGSKYRLIAPDLRGFGKSGPALPVGKEPAVTRMEDLAGDVLALLDHLGVEQAVVGGVSMGGYVAMALLRQDPGRVKGLLLIDTQLGADDDVAKRRREETAREVEAGGMDVLVDSMVPRLLRADAPTELRESLERLIRSNLPRGAAAASRGMALRTASRDILSRYSGPALVVVGEDDVITPLAKARELTDVIAGAELVQIPRAGHLSNLEAPGPFNQALETFLGRIV